MPYAPVQQLNFLDDSLDGDDIVAICEDEKDCCFYFLEFKEWSRFKGLVKVETEKNQARTFIILWFYFSYEIIWIQTYFSPRKLESAVPKRACQIFRWEAFNGNLVTVGFFNLIFTSLGDFIAKESHFVDRLFPCLNNWNHQYLKGDNWLHRPFIILLVM